AGSASHPGGRGHLQCPRPDRPRDDPDHAAVLRPLQYELGADADLAEHRPRDLPRRGDRPFLPDAETAPRGTDGIRLAALRVRLDYEAWEPFYVQILNDFGFSQ